MQEFAARENHTIRAIGLGSPGSIDFEQGCVVGVVANLQGWSDLAIRDVLREKIDLPIWIDNDANLVAIAEARVGAGKGFRNMVFVTVGTGVGGGIIIDGKLYRGASFNAAEIGHMSIDSAGKNCPCGGIGCLERYASAPAIVKLYLEKMKHQESTFDGANITTEVIFERAEKADSVALETVNEACDYLGAGLASVVNLLNPEAIVIGGGVSGAGEAFLGRVRDAISKRALPAALTRLKVIKAELGNDAGLVGAILLAAENTV